MLRPGVAARAWGAPAWRPAPPALRGFLLEVAPDRLLAGPHGGDPEEADPLVDDPAALRDHVAAREVEVARAVRPLHALHVVDLGVYVGFHRGGDEVRDDERPLVRHRVHRA